MCERQLGDYLTLSLTAPDVHTIIGDRVSLLWFDDVRVRVHAALQLLEHAFV